MALKTKTADIFVSNNGSAIWPGNDISQTLDSDYLAGYEKKSYGELTCTSTRAGLYRLERSTSMERATGRRRAVLHSAVNQHFLFAIANKCSCDL